MKYKMLGRECLDEIQIFKECCSDETQNVRKGIINEKIKVWMGMFGRNTHFLKIYPRPRLRLRLKADIGD